MNISELKTTLKENLARLGVTITKPEPILESILAEADEKLDPKSLTISIPVEDATISEDILDLLAQIPILNEFTVTTYIDNGNGGGSYDFQGLEKPDGTYATNMKEAAINALQRKKEYIDTFGAVSLTIEYVSPA